MSGTLPRPAGPSLVETNDTSPSGRCCQLCAYFLRYTRFRTASGTGWGPIFCHELHLRYLVVLAGLDAVAVVDVQIALDVRPRG